MSLLDVVAASNLSAIKHIEERKYEVAAVELNLACCYLLEAAKLVRDEGEVRSQISISFAEKENRTSFGSTGDAMHTESVFNTGYSQKQWIEKTNNYNGLPYRYIDGLCNDPNIHQHSIFDIFPLVFLIHDHHQQQHHHHRTTMEIIQELENTFFILQYNMAFCHHCAGLRTGNSKVLQNARELYGNCLNRMLMLWKDETVGDMVLVCLAVANNLGQVNSECFNHGDAEASMTLLGSLLSHCCTSRQENWNVCVTSHHFHQLYTSFRLYQDQSISSAAAA